MYANGKAMRVNCCTISGNSAGSGGGAYAWNSTFINCTISDNTGSYGAGVYASNSTLTNCVISDNLAEKEGGGTKALGTTALNNCSISGNSAVSGGGVYATSDSDSASLFTLTNCVIVKNSATNGAGVYAFAESESSSEQFVLANATITQNTATEKSGGVYAQNVTIRTSNSIVVGNNATSDVDFYDDSSNIIARNVMSSYAGWDVESDCIGYDSELPLFNDAQQGDFSLPYNSQALDKGNNDYVDVATDFTGGARITGQAVDLGAYEYQIPLTGIVLSSDEPKLGVKISTTISPDDATVVYHWYRVDANDEATEIEGEAQSSYTPTDADVGYRISVVANGSGYYSGTQTATTSEYMIGNISGVSISTSTDVLLIGTELTANVDPSLATADYQWYRVDKNGVATAIDGANTMSYTTTNEDLGSYLKVTVNGTDYWKGKAFAQTSTVVRAALTGITLSTYAPTPNVAVTTSLLPQGATASYQWYRVDASDVATAIDGANEASYTPTEADSSYYLKVVATGTGDYALSVEAISTDLYVKPQVVEISNPTQEMFARAILNVENGGTITLASDATISIASTINVDKSLTIKGAKGANIVFDGRSVLPTTSTVLLTTGNDSSTRRQLYNVEAGKTLTLENVTLQYGYADFGGAIYNAGTVTLTDVTLLNNAASKNGGAVFCTPTGTLSINGKTTFEGNTADNSGGAIVNYGTVSVESGATAEFNGNSAYNFGGAYFGCGAFTVDGTANFANNKVTASESKGGAIYNDAYTSDKGTKFRGVVTINGSATFTGNSAKSRGGAIMTYGDATAYDSLSFGSSSSVTFTRNSAEFGGAIDVGKSAKATFNGTVNFGTEGDANSGNRANYGGAIYSAGSVAFTSGGTYKFYYNEAEFSGGAICASNYETTPGADYVAGSLRLCGSFVFDGNKAKGEEYEGLGGAIATATQTTADFESMTWKDNVANGYGNCVAIDLRIGANGTLVPNSFGLVQNADFSTFKIIKQELASSTSTLTPNMLASSAVSATIMIGGETTTFGKEGVSPEQLGLEPGTYQALVQYVDEEGETSAVYSLALTVNPDASLEVRETNFANGRGVKFNFDLTKVDGRAVAVWEIAWGDGTTTRSEKLSTSWFAAHYYAKDGIFNVSLTVTYLDGSSETFDAFSTQKIGAAPVATTAASEVLSAVFAEVEDVFEEIDELELFVPYGPALPRR